MGKPLEFDNGTLISPNRKWKINQIMGIEFNLNLDGDSKVTFSVQKEKQNKSVLLGFCLLLIKGYFSYIFMMSLASYSIILSISLGILLLKIFLPKYWKLYQDCYSTGVLTFTFQDPVEFISFQKAIWDDERGKYLIKSGFVLGKGAEKLFYVFLAPAIYNSERVRKSFKFLVKVVYPVFVIILPLFLVLSVSIAKNSKFIYKALRKDRLLNLVWKLAEEGVDLIEDVADDYRWSKRLWKNLETFFDYLGDAIEVAFHWLRAEFLLIFMQIEYFNHCYVAVWKSFLNFSKFFGRILTKFGLSWVVKTVEKGANRFHSAVKVDEVRDVYEKAEAVKEEIDKVQENLEKKKQ